VKFSAGSVTRNATGTARACGAASSPWATPATGNAPAARSADGRSPKTVTKNQNVLQPILAVIGATDRDRDDWHDTGLVFGPALHRNLARASPETAEDPHQPAADPRPTPDSTNDGHPADPDRPPHNVPTRPCRQFRSPIPRRLRLPEIPRDRSAD